jgi:alkanesulfonate monooxygenase SsuD/methylene tetrahydromethanopterin reductase-like flavin-dependent oxidoreductase (luciferase family)
MAGELGLGYAFAGFINPDGASGALLRHGAFSAPAANGSAGGRGILSVSAVVADTDAEARRLNWSRTALMARLARQGSAVPLHTLSSCGCGVMSKPGAPGTASSSARV